jgi:hypothetical protein
MSPVLAYVVLMHIYILLPVCPACSSCITIRQHPYAPQIALKKNSIPQQQQRELNKNGQQE